LGTVYQKYLAGNPKPEKQRNQFVENRKEDGVVHLPTAADQEIIDDLEQVCPAFRRLWAKDFAGIATKGDGLETDLSSADMAVVNAIATVTTDDEQIDRVYRLWGHARDKWDRADYSSRTITKALGYVEQDTGFRRWRLHRAEEMVDQVIDFQVRGGAATLAAVTGQPLPVRPPFLPVVRLQVLCIVNIVKE
jgi:hypothetical protein